MPAKTEKQRRFMAADLNRLRSGRPRLTRMREEGLKEFAEPNANTMATKSIDKDLFKSINMIDAYLFKHGHVLPCGHHAEDGDEIDKACTMSNCGGVGGIANNPQQGKSGTVYQQAPNLGSAPGGGSMGIHATGGGSSSSGGATGSGTMTSSSPPEGGFRRSADSIELINRYLNKQSRLKCGHKKGDPNHLEAA